MVEELKPNTYTISVCTQFKEGFGSAVGLQQIAILSIIPAAASWAENWNTVSISDPPRGFAFASYRIGTNDIGVYGVHLTSNLTRGDVDRGRQLNILKRELAAEKIMRHINESPFNKTNKLEVVIVGGDFNTTLDQNEFASERTLTILRDNQFESGYESIELKKESRFPVKKIIRMQHLIIYLCSQNQFHQNHLLHPFQFRTIIQLLERYDSKY